ncbi:hypothetical protein MRX96_007689 [Rhipicephalus microplus]
MTEQGSKTKLSVNMKNVSAITLLAALTVFTLMNCGIEAAGNQPHLRIRRGTGCPDLGQCFVSCYKEGHIGGYCILLSCVCI